MAFDGIFEIIISFLFAGNYLFRLETIFFKMGQSRPLFLFIIVFSTCYKLNSNLNWWKHRWCAWDPNPGWQDGRRKRIHWAMAAPQVGDDLGSFFEVKGGSLAFEVTAVPMGVMATAPALSMNLVPQRVCIKCLD